MSLDSTMEEQHTSTSTRPDDFDNNRLNLDVENNTNVILDVPEDEKEMKGTKKKAIIQEIISWVVTLLSALMLALVINRFVLFVFTVPTCSMENTIMTDSRIMSLRCAYWFSEPERGDIVVFPYPDDPDQTFIKRIIGLPGETIEGKDGMVYINGEPYEEDYVTSEIAAPFGPIEIPEGSYFCMGDNRNDSKDSRFEEVGRSHLS